MKTTRIISVAALLVGSGLALYVARAQQPGIKRHCGAAAMSNEVQQAYVGSLMHPLSLLSSPNRARQAIRPCAQLHRATKLEPFLEP